MQENVFMNKTTWSHKNTYLCALSVRHRFMYLTARFTSFKEKCPLSGAKTRVKYVNPGMFFVDIGMYCCVYTTLLQERIAAVQNSNIRGLSLKVIVLEICPTPNPTLNLPDSVNKCKTYIKTYLLMQPCHFNFLICRFELLCRTVVTRDSHRRSSPPKYVSVLRELPNKLTVYENP